MKTRLFLGFPVPRPIQVSLAQYSQALLFPELRWVKPENYHITISFFGEQEHAKIEEISDVISSVTTQSAPFTFHFDGITLAPPKKQPSMIWAQYQSTETFTKLVRSIEKALSNSFTFTDQREGHEPLPHITLARFRNLSTRNLPQIELDSLHVTEAVLYSSQKTETGSVYTQITSFPLK
jgi:2'-5' RNA ligase